MSSASSVGNSASDRITATPAVSTLCAPFRAQQDPLHADLLRARDVVSQAVADHHGFRGSDAHFPQRRLEDARVRLHEAVIERRNRDRHQAVEARSATRTIAAAGGSSK